MVTLSNLFRVLSFSRGHLGLSTPKPVPPGSMPGPAAALATPWGWPLGAWGCGALSQAQELVSAAADGKQAERKPPVPSGCPESPPRAVIF